MKNMISRGGVLLFFSLVIIVSIVMIVSNKNNTDSIETSNEIDEIIPADITVTADGAEGEYGHDIEQYYDAEYTMPADDAQTVTEAPVQGENDFSSPFHSETGEVTAPPKESGDASSTTSRTIITSRQRQDYDKNSVYIDMENILQNPELPVGCEITALTILLRYYGFDAEKTDLARNYLPQSWGNTRYEDGRTYKDSFYTHFIGDPFSRGYGCFSGAIVTAAEKYIAAHGGGYTVENISGCSPDTLYEYLIAGTPVICWATDGMIEPEYYETWYDNITGEQLDWYLNEHCFVLAGFNIKNNTVTLNDPMKGIIDYNIDKFEVRFKEMNRQAIVFHPVGESTVTVTVSPEETTVPEEVSAADTVPSETSPEYSDTVWETSAETISETAAVTTIEETAIDTSETTPQPFTGFPE